jgi:hypothetical protein
VTCPSCAHALQHPRSCEFWNGCLGCETRQLAHSPSFFDSVQAETLTPAYRSALQFVFGGDWVAGHAKVKAAAKLIAEAPKEKA